jgi:hypothetical protein
MVWIVIIASIYVGFCLFFYFFQHLFFFRPEKLTRAFEYKYPFPFEELDFDMEDGGRINAIYFKVPNSRGVVYYLKGNSKSIKGWGKFAKDFLSNGYDFFMMDYAAKRKYSTMRNTFTNGCRNPIPKIKSFYMAARGAVASRPASHRGTSHACSSSIHPTSVSSTTSTATSSSRPFVGC